MTQAIRKNMGWNYEQETMKFNFCNMSALHKIRGKTQKLNWKLEKCMWKAVKKNKKHLNLIYIFKKARNLKINWIESKIVVKDLKKRKLNF